MWVGEVKVNICAAVANLIIMNTGLKQCGRLSQILEFFMQEVFLPVDTTITRMVYNSLLRE